MFCYKCGKELEEGSVFCRFCGAKVPQTPAPQVPVPQEPAAAPVPERTAQPAPAAESVKPEPVQPEPAAAPVPERTVQPAPAAESIQPEPVQTEQEEQEEEPEEKKKGGARKVLKWILRLLLVAVLAFAVFAAAQNGNLDGILKLHRRAGFWSVSSSTAYVPNRDYVWLELNEDGTGTLNMGWGDVRSVKWYDGFQSGHFDIDGQKTEFNYSGYNGSFAINIDGNLVSFYKSEKPVPYDDVSFVKAEVIEDIDGHPALRVYFNWTNKTDHNQAPICSVGHPWYFMHMGQPGGYKEHADISAETLVPEDLENYLKEVAPGETVCLSQIMKYNPAEDAVVILYRFDACDRYMCDVYLFEEKVLSGWNDRQGSQITARIAKGTLEITESVENEFLDRD